MIGGGGSRLTLLETLCSGEHGRLVAEPRAPRLCPLCLPLEDEQREKSVSCQTVQQLVLEKEQALADLNSVEKSLADLFRRYEKMKEVLEGFRKVCLHGRGRAHAARAEKGASCMGYGGGGEGTEAVQGAEGPGGGRR